VVRATVTEWNDAEGWGVLEAASIPERIWAHFSALQVDGYKTLRAGDVVEADVEGPLSFSQDGYRYRARTVWPSEAPTAGG
jgi:cold shock CspA family protein